MKLVDEGFVADKEDGVSPTDDSGGDDSDGSLSEGDKEKGPEAFRRSTVTNMAALIPFSWVFLLKQNLFN
ncbi:hypothetical protein HanPI659440_Chr03g0120461 [Helianthus annuus]|nr:hypothetical protein HanPI659440_Chr03g0120461 [Helianthus annuus]